MTNRKMLAALALTALLGMSACEGEEGDEADPTPAQSDAGQVAPGMEPQMDPEMMALMAEAQALQQQLAPIEEEAMQDEALAAQLDELQEQIAAAMREENPEPFEQMEQLEAEYMAAQEAGDEERAQQVGIEAQRVQAELQGLQQSVMASPEVSGPIEDFEEARRMRMIEIDPEAGELLDRIEEIFAELQVQ